MDKLVRALFIIYALLVGLGCVILMLGGALLGLRFMLGEGDVMNAVPLIVYLLAFGLAVYTANLTAVGIVATLFTACVRPRAWRIYLVFLANVILVLVLIPVVPRK